MSAYQALREPTLIDMTRMPVTPTAPRALARGLRSDLAAAAEGLEHAARFALPVTSTELILTGIGPAMRRRQVRETHLAAARHALELAEAQVDEAIAADTADERLSAIVRTDLRRAAFHEAAALRLAA